MSAWGLAFAILAGVASVGIAPTAAPVLQHTPKPPDVGFLPTPHVVADAMLKLARVTADDVVYDLGSGDGRLVILAAERYGARGVGVEIDTELVRFSREAVRTHGVSDRVDIIEDDLFTTDISKATVVTLFLSPSVNRRLEPKLKNELRPGTRIVAHMFRIGDWTPDERDRAPDGGDLFLWTVPRPPSRPPDTDGTATPPAVVDEMLTLAGVGAGDVVYDLGSGDGRIVILAAQKYGARGVGVEIDPPLVEKSRQIAQDGGVTGRVTFVEADLFTASIAEATVVTLALSPGVNARLEPKLKQELRPGTRVVSRGFGIGAWVPDRTLRARDGADLFLWTVPAR